MTDLTNKLPQEWQDAWNKLKNNKIFRTIIEQAYEDNMLEALAPEMFFNGEIEKHLVDSHGISLKNIENIEKKEPIKFIVLINNVYSILDLDKDDYTYKINRVTPKMIEFSLWKNNNSLNIQFTHNSNYYVRDIFIIKNNLFYRNQDKIIYNIFLNEPVIDFEL